MAKIDFNKSTETVLAAIGGESNVSSFTNCQTRLRVNVKDLSKVDKKQLEDVEGQLGINITGQQVQVIYGTGKVVKAADAFDKLVPGKRGEPVDAEDEGDLASVAANVKAKQKAANTSGFQKFLGKFANIFAPMILGFIGAGILAGIAGIMTSAGADSTAAGKSWINIFNLLLTIWKGTFLVIVGWRTAQAFGGSGVIGAIIAGIYVTAFSANVGGMFIQDIDKHGYVIMGIHIADPLHNWLTVGLRPSVGATGAISLSYPSGSVFGVMISAGFVGLIEKGLRKVVPAAVDTILTPTFALLFLVLANIFLVMPVSGYIFTGVTFLFKNLYGNPFGAAMLAGIFLITVVFGIHQGFVPVYAGLIASTGVNGLFPILGMAGAGQVGMAIALWFRAEEGGKLRKQIQGAIIPGFLGIGEPLIYGVSLPRVKPFITASIGGAFGAFFIGAFNLWGGDVVGLNTMFGPSGLLAAPLMTSVSGSIVKGVLVYLGGLAISYAGGFATTYFLGYKNVDLA